MTDAVRGSHEKALGSCREWDNRWTLRDSTYVDLFLCLGWHYWKPLWRWLFSLEICSSKQLPLLPVATHIHLRAHTESDTSCIWHLPHSPEMWGMQQCNCAIIIHISSSHFIRNHYHLNNCVTSLHILCHNLTSLVEPLFREQSHAFMFRHDISNEPWLKGSGWLQWPLKSEQREFLLFSLPVPPFLSLFLSLFYLLPPPFLNPQIGHL